MLGGKPVLDELALRVALHGRVGIVGRSGTGKSTLLALVAGLDEQDVGTASVCGETSAPSRLAVNCLNAARKALTIVGSVRPSVISPAMVTAPAPM